VAGILYEAGPVASKARLHSLRIGVVRFLPSSGYPGIGWRGRLQRPLWLPVSAGVADPEIVLGVLIEVSAATRSPAVAASRASAM